MGDTVKGTNQATTAALPNLLTELAKFILWLAEHDSHLKIEDADGTGPNRGKRVFVVQAKINDVIKYPARTFVDEKSLVSSVMTMWEDIQRYEATLK